LSLVACCAIGHVMGCQGETASAAGYNEQRFMALRKGSTPDDVRAAIGAPLETWTHWGPSGVVDSHYWSYQRRTSALGTHHAVVIFSADWKLIDREPDWYED
jgi:hypothetical protein